MAAIEQTAQRAQRLAGRTVVITGSSSGIGRAIALRAADEGAQVVVSDVRPDPVEGGCWKPPRRIGTRSWPSTCAVSSSAANGRSPRCSSLLTGAGDFSEEPIEYSRSRTPFFRLGRPSDVAAAVAFLASDDALYVSGTNLLVDGGWMAY